MTQLVLMRHGTAVDRGDPLCPADADRPLTVRAASRAKLSARALRTLGVTPQLILSSPYLRAMQTAKIVAAELSIPKKRIRASEALAPEASPADLWSEVRAAGRDLILCVGHGPGLDALLAELLGTPARAMWLKKGGAAAVELSLEGDAVTGKLEWLLPPRLLRSFARS
ncbi:MAG: hypothetical protein EP329_12835 [Deltaproteobacteria bacterium]|nr:MAG: hypothetical protein EP329_12835 [Deltaproteobacteria bacterium]